MTRRFRWIILFFAAAFTLPPCMVSAGPLLPVYIEDNHAGSFYWLARNLDWTQKYHLILFDRHSDATALFNSDFIRKTLNNRNGSKKDNARFTSWKKKGTIQCFNWIEPLLPHPIHKITWVPDGRLTSDELTAKKKEVIRNINEHISVAPRSSGDLSNIYTISDFTMQKEIINFTDPVIVSIDLDYFVDVPKNETEPKFAEILDYVLHIKQLKAVTIAISRPYLKSDEQADLLLSIALKYFSRVINSKIYFEPFTSYGPDRSELAKAYYKKHLPVPAYDVRKASSRLVSLILLNPSRYIVSDDQKRWREILDLWSRNYKQPELVLSNKDGFVPIQTCNYFSYRDDFTISVNTLFEQAGDDGITWKAVSSSEKSYNILGKGGFAENAPAFVVFKEISLNDLRNKNTIRSDQLNNLFDDRTGFGTIRLFAEIMLNGTYYRTKTICISKYANTDYTGKLTEIFNLPYVLGSGFLNVDGLSGADAHYGADCLNFIIYGQRRMGSTIPYLNENNLRQYLTKVDDVLFFKDGIAYNNSGKVVIDPQLIHGGLLLHFGTHIAAFYQDNEPRNILNDDDLVIHQIENKPEIIELKKLKQSKSPFMLMKFR